MISHGITGNVYAYGPSKNEVIKIAKQIGKSPNSVYYNKKHQCYAIRVKHKLQKRRLLALKETNND